MKTKNRKRLLFVLVILISVSMMGFMLTGAADPSAEAEPEEPVRTILHTLDWQMHGTVLASDGTVLEKVAFTVTGEFWEEEAYDCALFDINIDFPESFEIDCRKSKNVMNIFDFSDFGLDHYVCLKRTQYKNTVIDGKYPCVEPTEYGVDVENEYLIFRWDDGSGRYLVASTDPTVDPAEIFSRFSHYAAYYSVCAEYAKKAAPYGVAYAVPVEFILADMETMMQTGVCSATGTILTE